MKDPKDPEPFDDGFLDDLSPRNRERFEGEFEANLEEFDEDALDRKLSTYFDEAEEHLKLVKAVAACFHPREGAGRSKSGFRFVGVNPLCSVEQTPADALLLKPEYNAAYLCVVCCEIGGETRGQWVKNVNESKQVFDSRDNRDLLMSQLNLESHDLSVQYVTQTRIDDVTDMDFAVLDRNCDAETYAVWSADVEDKWMMHEEGHFVHGNLQDAFSDPLDYMRREDPLRYAVGTHPVFPLQAIVYRIVKEKFELDDKYKSEFQRETFYDYFDRGLQVQCTSDSRERVVESEVERLIDIALKTGVFSEADDDCRSNRDYRVMYSGTRGPDRAENAVKPKYFENIAQVELGQRAYDKTRDEFERDANLSDWVE